MLAQSDRGEHGRRNGGARSEWRELDPPHAGGVRTGHGRGGVGGEARLPAAARSGQRQEPDFRQQAFHLDQFHLSADERCELGREVVGHPVERLQRRERARQPGVGDLEDVLGAGQVPEPVAAEIDECRSVRQGVEDELGGRPGNDRLAAVGNGSQAGVRMIVESA